MVQKTKMNEIIYLEPDEDIAGVISRVKGVAEGAVCLVIPRGASISQSVINLKLLKREIEKMGKMVSLVTKDKISRNLASQVGITVYSTVSEAKNIRTPETGQSATTSESGIVGFSSNSLKINRYKKEEDEADDESIEGVSEETDRESGEADDEPENLTNVEMDKLNQERTAMATAKPNVVNKGQIHDTNDSVKAIEKTTGKNLSSRKKPILIISSVLLILVLVATVVLVPAANAKIVLKTSDIEVAVDLTANKSITEPSLQDNQIPATYYEVSKELEKEFTATGKKDVGTKAGGEISFYNNYDPQSAVPLANGTALIADGKTYYLDGAITIPPATVVSLYPTKINPGTTKGKIVAKESGESYNIAATNFIVSSFSGSKRENVYGQSAEALTGGTTKEITIVSNDDIEKSEQALIAELDNAIKEEITTLSAADDVKLILSSLRESVVSFSSDKKADEEADVFKSKITYSINELGVKEKDLQKYILDQANTKLQADEMYVNPNPNQISYDYQEIDGEKGTVAISGKFSGKVGKKIESSKIVEMLVRGKLGSAESRVAEIPGVDRVEIDVTPKFWPMLPLIKQRITVDFAYAE